MKHFFAVHIADLESDAFDRATSEQITIWLYLHAYCTKQFNSGLIEEAKSIQPKFWGRIGVDSESLKMSSPLWSWEGEDLRIHPYDIDGQELAEKKSNGGKLGAHKRWGKAANGSANRSLTCTNQPTKPNQHTKPTKPTKPNQPSNLPSNSRGRGVKEFKSDYHTPKIL